MTGLVLELQRDALDPSVPVGDLLRKASVISRKLNLSDVQEWISLELGGYRGEVPEYRKAYGEVKVFNPFHGWQPVQFPTNEMAESVSQRQLVQSLAELEDLLTQDPKQLTINFPSEAQAVLAKMFKTDLQFAIHLKRQHLLKVVEAVRNKILNLTLDWEQRGILGEGLSFSREERAKADSITYNTINHIGEMNNSQLQQHSSGSQTLNAGDAKALIALADAVSAAIGQLKLAADDRAELEAEIATLRSQAASPRPKGGIIRATLSSIKTILEGAAGNVAAGPLLAQLTPLLPGLLG